MSDSNSTGGRSEQKESKENITEKIYNSQLTFAEDMRKRIKKSKIVAHPKPEEWGSTRQNKSVYLIFPELGFIGTNITMFKAEIPAGKHTGKHRHINDASIYILSGKGYSIVEDERYEWEKGDAVYVPSWAWHQHFNPSPTEPVEYLGATTSALMRTLGIKRSEQAEDKNYE